MSEMSDYEKSEHYDADFIDKIKQSGRARRRREKCKREREEREEREEQREWEREFEKHDDARMTDIKCLLILIPIPSIAVIVVWLADKLGWV